MSVERFHVSGLNVRAGRPFGESEEDRALIDHLKRGKIIGPFKARPERDGYGVVVGRRRFLAKKEVGANCSIGISVPSKTSNIGLKPVLSVPI